MSCGAQIGVRLASAGAAAGSPGSGSRVTATISSSEMMELTIAPSSVVALKQLQALAVAAKTWQSEQALLQQLLQHLAAPVAGSSLSAAGASCWLVNETGAPLSYVVADAVMEPAAATAALGTCSSGSTNSSSSSPVRPLPSAAAGSQASASARGQAAHLTPVPLRVLDVAAAGYFGRFVEQGSVSDACFKLQELQPGQSSATSPAAEASTTAAAAGTDAADRAITSSSSGGVKQSQLLYVQAAGRVEVVGPVSLSQMGCSVHPLRGLAAGGVLSPGKPSSGAGRYVAVYVGGCMSHTDPSLLPYLCYLTCRGVGIMHTGLVNTMPRAAQQSLPVCDSGVLSQDHSYCWPTPCCPPLAAAAAGGPGRHSLSWSRCPGTGMGAVWCLCTATSSC